MPKIVALDNAYALVQIDTDQRMVHHKFKKFIYGQAFREALTAGAELMEKHRAIKWLSDDRENAALPPEDAEWAKSFWFPRVRKAGWKHWAVVMPAKVVGKMNMEQFVAQYREQGIEVRVFTRDVEAVAWLTSF